MDFVLDQGPVKKERYTIGYLDNNQQNDFHNQLLLGVAEAAHDLPVDIIRFGYYSSHIAYKFSHQVAMVLDHVQQYDLDGLLFLGWTRAGAMYNYDDFTHRFRSIPILSLGTIYADIPSVYFSGDQFVSHIVRHLVEMHGCRNIAYIEHHRPDNRKDFYERTLQELDLWQPDLYVGAEQLQGLNALQRNQRAIEILLDERGCCVDAIVTLNIIEAGYVIDALEKRGLQVPDDVKVTGYEDSDVGLFSAPARTTIYFPWKELGSRGLHQMLQLLQKGQVPMTTALDDLGRITYRESCGCIPDLVRSVAASSCAPARTRLLEMSTGEKEEILARLEKEIDSGAFDLAALLDAFIAACRAQQKEVFLKSLDTQLRLADPTASITALMTVFRKQLMPFLKKDRDRMIWAGDLFLQSQVLVYERAIGLHGNRYLQERMTDQSLQIVNQTLLLHFGLQNLSDSLAAGLPQIGVHSCSIFVSESILTGAEVEALFDRSVEVFRFHEGKVQKTPQEPQPLQALIREQRAAMNDKVSLAYLLHVTDEIMGFALFGAGTLDEVVYQQLATHVSTALQGIVLLNRLNITYKQLVANAHRQGMADIATDILHNIGNILNSINVSLHLIDDQAKAPFIDDVRQAGDLLSRELSRLKAFMRDDPRGPKLMQFYLQLSQAAESLQSHLLQNVKRVKTKVTDIEQTVTAQQTYAGIDSQVALHALEPILEDVLKLHAENLQRYQIDVAKEGRNKVKAQVHRGKLFFVLFSLIDQAVDMLKHGEPGRKKLIFETAQTESGKVLRMHLVGPKTPVEALRQLLDQDSAELSDSRQFSLYSCISYMKDMGGSLETQSLEAEHKTTFVLKFTDEEALA